MCGYVGLYFKKEIACNEKKEIIKSLGEKIIHRGPDDLGIDIDDNFAMCFRRLSIVDVEGGHQPFTADENTMVFNGEIYNYDSLKEELVKKGIEFTTNSDTEVLLKSYIEKGKDSLKELRGMYSFIINNKKSKEIFGARDIFGIKPLYYIDTEDYIGFASEYKALVDLIDKKTIDKKSLERYMSFQYVPRKNTILNEIKVIEPGEYFTIVNGKLKIRRYNKIEFREDREVKKEEILEAMKNSVEKHMNADFEVGTFLSGGVDSSIIATLASKINPKIKSFTIGFGERGYDEIEVAKKTSKALGIENISIVVGEREYIEALPEIVKKMDDPVADPSLVGLYFLSKEARKHVKVVLSGEGADELFGGYNIYKEYYSIKPFSKMPKFLKKIINNIAKRLPNIKGKSYLLRATTDLEERYIGNAKIFESKEIKKVIKGYKEVSITDSIKDIYDEIKGKDNVSKMQLIDINTWLEGDILAKGDKMSMANSLELRVPFLDKEVLKVSRRLSLTDKISKKNSKVLLREAFKGIVPEVVIDKKKLGFPTPIRLWLKSDLGTVVKDTIESADVNEYINKEYALELLKDHIDEKRDNSRKVWAIFIFCLWHKIYMENENVDFSYVFKEEKSSEYVLSEMSTAN